MGSVMRGFAPTSEIGRGIMVIGISVQNTMMKEKALKAGKKKVIFF